MVIQGNKKTVVLNNQILFGSQKEGSREEQWSFRKWSDHRRIN